ncbi:MAG TPA: DUF748 domain-containing protein [Opitutaceae bacterium]|nr:DUF748 domain-containing protein [Opitutaceae bacterium]
MHSPPGKLVQRVRSWPRRVVITVGVIVLVLAGIRIALPYVIRNQINTRLKNIPGYRGRVGDIRLSLWRGAYTLRGISIFKLNGNQEDPFFIARFIDFSLSWPDLFHGKFVSRIYVDHGELTFVKGPTPQTTQKATDQRWQSVVEDIFPIDIQHLEISHGLIRYIDDTHTPRVDLFVKNMEAVATGLRNRPGDTKQEFPARIQVEGDSLGGGHLDLLVQAEPLAAKPHFHLALKLTHVNLVALDDSLKSVANVEVNHGTFEMVAEMAGREGAFQGYVKPFFNNLDLKPRQDKKSVATRLWEKVVAGLAWLVKNRPRDQVATRIPFQGEFGDSQVGLWPTIRNLFRHGFVRAFNPVIEQSVNPDKVPPPSQIAPKKSSPAVRKKAEKNLEQENDAKASATESTGKK